MEIHFGWGSREAKFVPGDEKVSPHVAWVHRERGGIDASPTGISYHWWSDPSTIPMMVDELQRLYAEYDLWLTRELVRYQENGSPMSDEQVSKIEKARANGLL